MVRRNRGLIALAWQAHVKRHEPVVEGVPPHFAIWTNTIVSVVRFQLIGIGTAIILRPLPLTVSNVRKPASVVVVYGLQRAPFH